MLAVPYDCILLAEMPDSPLGGSQTRMQADTEGSGRGGRAQGHAGGARRCFRRCFAGGAASFLGEHQENQRP